MRRVRLQQSFVSFYYDGIMCGFCTQLNYNRYMSTICIPWNRYLAFYFVNVYHVYSNSRMCTICFNTILCMIFLHRELFRIIVHIYIQLIFDNLTSLPIHTFTWNPCSTNIAIGYLWIPLQSSLIRYNLGCVEIQVQNWFSDIVYFQPTCIIIIQSSTGSL